MVAGIFVNGLAEMRRHVGGHLLRRAPVRRPGVNQILRIKEVGPQGWGERPGQEWGLSEGPWWDATACSSPSHRWSQSCHQCRLLGAEAGVSQFGEQVRGQVERVAPEGRGGKGTPA